MKAKHRNLLLPLTGDLSQERSEESEGGSETRDEGRVNLTGGAQRALSVNRIHPAWLKGE